MTKKANLLALLIAGAVTILVVAGLSNAASTAAPTNQTSPSISGTAQVGKTLSGAQGSWNGTSPIHYAYQWRRCNANGSGCSNIGGADSSTYQLQSSDRGHTVRFHVKATNSDGSASADSNPSNVVQPASSGGGGGGGGGVINPATGCPTAGSGVVDASQLVSPAHLVIDGQTASPSVITRSTGSLTLRFHVSACNGRPVQNALVLAEAIPFLQFTIPAEVPTDSTGWGTVTMQQDRAFPASSKQQLLAVFVRARKQGEPLLAGIAARRLVSFPVHV